jgi:hypothetical protein
MSDLPGAVTALAAIRGEPVSNVRRLFASGKVPGAYQTKGGHWRIRKLPAGEVEIVIKMHCAKMLSAIQAEFFPHLNEILEAACVLKAISGDDIVTIRHPGRLKEPHVKLRLKAQALLSRGDKVTAKNLAAAMNISVWKLNRHYGRELIKSICHPAHGDGSAGRSPAARARHSALDAMFFDKKRRQSGDGGSFT